jgi:GntR family transcriptional regulator / MocR family aminotransferase
LTYHFVLSSSASNPMSRARPALAPLLVPLDPASPVPLHRQLYAWLRDAILSGRLAGGTRLPATRQLARELKIARSTVVGAFDELMAEGFLIGRHGSGTYVAPLTLDGPAGAMADARSLPAPVQAPPYFSLAGAALAELHGLLAERMGPPVAAWTFQVGVPDVRLFPHALWRRMLGRAWHSMPPALLAQPQPAGSIALRETIAHYLASARGLRCTPEQVIIVGGSQQGLALAAQVLLGPNDAVLMEDPGYFGARLAFTAARARVVPVPLDADGLDLAAGQARAPQARLVYVTPSHQFPLGMTMSLVRRLALLEWAKRVGAWILEDDYDSEYHYAGRPLKALQGLDEDGRVIYVGTFSKTLLPNIRLGYLVVPLALRDAFMNSARALGTQAPVLEQATLAQFIAEGHFVRHVRRMLTHYAARQAALVEAVRELLPGVLRVSPAPTGLHLVGWLPPGVDDVAASRAAAQAGVAAQPLSLFQIESRQPAALVLGYAAAHSEAIRAAVERLAAALLPLCGNRTKVV